MKSSRITRAPLAALVVSALAFAGSALAQTAAPAAPPAPAIAAPASPSMAPASPSTPAPGAPQAAPATPSAPAAQPPVAAPAPSPDMTKPSGDASNAQLIDIPGKPAAIFAARSSWDDGFASITGAFKRINAELAKAGLKSVGRPLAVFLDTDDSGFRFEAMVLLAEKPADRSALGNDVKLGLSPAGKAMKFQHRGAYDDIDSTYEAITAYLDEKNLESRNIFIEEYLTDPKTSDDVALEIDIYVFIK